MARSFFDRLPAPGDSTIFLVARPSGTLCPLSPQGGSGHGARHHRSLRQRMSDHHANDTTLPPAALALGLGGLLPFAFGAMAIWTGWRPAATPAPALAVQAYGAVILSFLGGIRWGLALRLTDGRAQASALAVSVLPSLAGWAALLLSPQGGLAVLAGLFAAMGAADLRIASLGAPHWFRRLRIILSAGAVFLLLLAWIGLRTV
jgi:hypothetical protein